MFGIFDLTFSKIVDPAIFVRESFIFAVTFLARRAQLVRTSPPIVSRVARPCRPHPNFSADVGGGGGGGRRGGGLRLRRQAQGEVVDLGGIWWRWRTKAIGLFDLLPFSSLQQNQSLRSILYPSRRCNKPVVALDLLLPRASNIDLA
jgi:hypothetical protein